MNINANSHFSRTPQITIPRSVFKRPAKRTFTCNAGLLIPFYWDEVLAGDTMKVTTSKVIRMQTLLSPIMDNIVADFYWWFIPNRIVHTHFPNVLGENTDSKWIPQQTYTTAKVTMGSGGTPFPKGSIGDYLGIPTEFPVGPVLAYPFRAYHDVWNNYFRDENVQDPVLIEKGDTTQQLSANAGDYLTSKYVLCRPVNKLHDYFTSALPAPLKAPEVRIPVSGFAPVGPTSNNHDPLVSPSSGLVLSPINGTNNYNLVNSSGTASLVYTSTSPANALEPVNLWAYLAPDFAGTISDLRLAFQIQKLYERDAYGGTRMQEILATHFGVLSPDARLQKPEYLGGNRIDINVSQVVNSASSSGEYLGDLGAYSHTVDVHADFVHSFQEPGILLGTMCIRFLHTYSQGLDPAWKRDGRFSYYWPELAHISAQPIFNYELYADYQLNDYDGVFGYKEPWAEYKYKNSYVAGEMRPGQNYSFDSWSLADYYSNAPSLSDTWMRESGGTIDRVLAVTSQNADQFWCDIEVENISTRPMPMTSIPGFADHF